MLLQKKNKLALINLLYWLLLIYVVAALVWWFVALHRQNEAMFLMRMAELNLDDPAYEQKAGLLADYRNRKEHQYVGEGLTFLILILLGALFVYRAVRRQLRLSRHQQNFMMAITHELKTPVAIAQLNLETLQKRQLTPQQQQGLIGNSLVETQRLGELCNNILAAARFDAGAVQSGKAMLNLSEQLPKWLEAFARRHPGRLGEERISPDLFVQADAQLLELLVSNLLDNAAKYSPKTSLIDVHLHATKKQILLQVVDHGPGVPEEEKKRIFDRFYRAGNEQTRTTKGTGLGLFLCRRIAGFHKGRLFVTNTPGGGATFTFQMPLQS